MLVLRVPAVPALAVRARAVRLHVNCTGFPMTRRARRARQLPRAPRYLAHSSKK